MRNLFGASAILASLVILAPQAEAGMRGTNHNRFATSKASTSRVVYVMPAAQAACVENTAVASVQVQSQPVAQPVSVTAPTSLRSPAANGSFIRVRR
ncbi:hypothetical protein SH449x_003890 [Pirellulaceae bacterium SH449]